MNLDLFNNLINNAKENELVQNLIKELTNYLENFNEKGNNQGMSIDSIEREYKLNTDSSKELKSERNRILKEQAEELEEGESLYYVSYKNEFKDTYQILEFDNMGENKSFYLSKEELPDNISVDKVMKKINDSFIIDNDLTQNVMNKIENSAKIISEKQNEKLSQYRNEGTLYQVVDHSSHGLYLQNKDNNIVFEETKLSEELMNKLGNDYILRYKDGEYIYEEELTEQFFQNLKN